MDLTDLIDLGSREKGKEKNRIDYLKNTLSPYLGAKFYSDIKQIKYVFFKNSKFTSYKSNSNVLVGKIDDKYEYCLCECYKEVTQKGKDYGNWVTFGSVKMPINNFPEFTFISKNAAVLMNGPKIIISSLFVSIITIISIYLLFNFPNIKTETEPFLVFSFLILVFFFISLFIILKIIVPSAKFLYQTNNQEKIFGIRDYELGDKYAITKEKLSNTDAHKIRKLFNSDVCSNILNIKSELIFFTSKDNCLLFDFDNEKLTEEKSDNYIRKMVEVVKAFEQNK